MPYDVALERIQEPLSAARLFRYHANRHHARRHQRRSGHRLLDRRRPRRDGGGSASCSAALYVAPTPAPAPEPTPEPPPPTAVTISGPGQSIVAVPGLPIRIAAGANVDGTTISFPANSPIVMELGGSPLTVTAPAGGAQLSLHTLTLDGQSVIVIAIGSGSVTIESQNASQYLLVFGSSQTPVQSGSGNTRFVAQRNGSGLQLIVHQGNILLPASSLATPATRGATNAANNKAATQAAVEQALPGATVSTQADGTVTLSSGAQRWTLMPASTLETAPAGQAAWWADAAGRYWLRNGDGTMQQFRIE